MEKEKAECQTPQVSARKVALLAGGGLGAVLWNGWRGGKVCLCGPLVSEEVRGLDCAGTDCS